MKIVNRIGDFFLRLLNPSRFAAMKALETLSPDQKIAVASLESASENYDLLVNGHTSAYLLMHMDALQRCIGFVFEAAVNAHAAGVPKEVINFYTPPEIREQLEKHLLPQQAPPA